MAFWILAVFVFRWKGVCCLHPKCTFFYIFDQGMRQCRKKVFMICEVETRYTNDPQKVEILRKKKKKKKTEYS